MNVRFRQKEIPGTALCGVTWSCCVKSGSAPCHLSTLLVDKNNADLSAHSVRVDLTHPTCVTSASASHGIRCRHIGSHCPSPIPGYTFTANETSQLPASLQHMHPSNSGKRHQGTDNTAARRCDRARALPQHMKALSASRHEQ